LFYFATLSNLTRIYYNTYGYEHKKKIYFYFTVKPKICRLKTMLLVLDIPD